MKPEAPPSSHETFSTSVKVAKSTPALRTAQGTVTVSARFRHASALPGYSNFRRSGSSAVRRAADSMMAVARCSGVRESAGGTG